MLTILHFLHRIVFRTRLKNKKISFPKSADERMDKEKNRDEKATSFDADSVRIFYESRYKNNIKSSQNQAHLTTFFILKN